MHNELQRKGAKTVPRTEYNAAQYGTSYDVRIFSISVSLNNAVTY
jgi:hypothetical protein